MHLRPRRSQPNTLYLVLYGLQPLRVALACPAVANLNGNVFGETAAGVEATGLCAAGYIQAASGAPKRQCKSDGSWADDIINACQRTVPIGRVV